MRGQTAGCSGGCTELEHWYAQPGKVENTDSLQSCQMWPGSTCIWPDNTQEYFQYTHVEACILAWRQAVFFGKRLCLLIRHGKLEGGDGWRWFLLRMWEQEDLLRERTRAVRSHPGKVRWGEEGRVQPAPMASMSQKAVRLYIFMSILILQPDSPLPFLFQIIT